MQYKQNKRHKQRIVSQLTLCLLSTIFILPAAFAANQAVFVLDKTLSSKALMDAGALIRHNDFHAAYQLLEPLESEHAGQFEFDYLFGIAAVESNHLTRGAFALERTLALQPKHLDARAEMAKAHLLLGELETAKTEFNNVLLENPDEKTRKTIEKLLTDIQKTEGTNTTFTAYLDLGLGWDSNVSSVPNISSIAVPIIGGTFQLGNTALAKSDSFTNLAAGLSFRHPFNRQFSVFGGVSGTDHLNGSETAFNNSTLDFNAGLQYAQNKNNWIISLQDSHFYLDSENFRHAYGGYAQWLYNIDTNNQASVYAQYTRITYTDNSANNTDRTIAGVNVGHAFQWDYKPVIFAGYYGGRDVARNADVNAISQGILGLKLGGQLNFNDQLQLFSTFNYELRDNDHINTTFLKVRKDNQYDASLGLRYSPARNWTIKPQISYTKNDSNIELYGYDRSIASINVRKDFDW